MKVLPVLLVSAAHAFVVQHSHVAHRTVLQETKEELRHDIEELETEAKEHMDHLLHQFEDLKKLEREKELERLTERLEAAVQKQEAMEEKEKTPIVIEEREPEAPKIVHEETKEPRYDLLVNTTWKLVFNIGREPGTWMPATWGASGGRVLLQATVHFTDEKSSYDEFFHGSSLKTTVTDAFLFPRGVGGDAVGRQPVRLADTASYRVSPGQGPSGTDLLKLDVDLLEDLEFSDIRIPAGKLYGTLGYFDLATRQTAAREEVVRNHQTWSSAVEDAKYNLEYQLESNPVSLDTLDILRELWKAEKMLAESTKEFDKMNMRVPELRNLRRFKDVALSKEGGVCCKVLNHFAVEYHILGRMEVACKDRHAL